jgi:Ca2+-dependent lipid-binding protein
MQDPYCVLTLGKQQFRTKVKNEAGKRPVWNETFNFNGGDNILKVKVMDQDTITDDVVGEGTVDITRFRNNPAEQQCI